MSQIPSHSPIGNIALLIDADNAQAAHLDPVLTVLAEFGTVNVRRAYGNWQKPGLKSWIEILMRHGIEPYQQFDVTKGKNATDMRMTIDAMDLLLRGRITGFGIMSSDSDFMPLAQRIRQDGVPVYGFGTDRTPIGFRESCTRFLDVASLDVEDVANMPLPPAIIGAPASPAPPAPPAEPRRKQKVDAAFIKLLSDAFDASKLDKRGFASLSEVGQRAANRSNFDTRNYGFKRLSDLIERVPNFEVERRDHGVFVKRA